jgi:hypothetical protein
VCVRGWVLVCVRKNANQENERNQYAPGGSDGKSATEMPFALARGVQYFYTYIFLGPTRNNKLCFADDARARVISSHAAAAFRHAALIALRGEISYWRSA